MDPRGHNDDRNTKMQTSTAPGKGITININGSSNSLVSLEGNRTTILNVMILVLVAVAIVAALIGSKIGSASSNVSASPAVDISTPSP